MTAADFLPQRRSLTALREAAATCRGCLLYRDATQTVFGEGRASAEVVMVGEQPGDQEDRRGKPFVGPAGRVLGEALEDAGIDRADVYITNVVKHFKFQPRGKRRIHKRPSAAETAACRPWLDAELQAIKPSALLALGATAAQDLFGRSFRVTKQRGRPLEFDFAPLVMASVHPSSILRAPDEEARREEYGLFVADLRALADGLQELREAS
ncbi:MAG TPA: UdgX family uracil-DNA binding protein [Actinomycetota bacterium]|nr:UdgX family uracil-DNA binding protein [Actinomycetota bacterium]